MKRLNKLVWLIVLTSFIFIPSVLAAYSSCSTTTIDEVSQANSGGLYTNSTTGTSPDTFWTADVSGYITRLNSSLDCDDPSIVPGVCDSKDDVQGLTTSNYPYEVIANGTNNYWVLYSIADDILELDSSFVNNTSGNNTNDFGCSQPAGIAWNGTDFWVACNDDQLIFHLDSSRGYMDNFSASECRAGGDLSIAGLDSNGTHLFLLNDDLGSSLTEICVFNQSNNLTSRVDLRASAIGLTTAKGMAVSDDGLTFWVTHPDSTNMNITKVCEDITPPTYSNFVNNASSTSTNNTDVNFTVDLVDDSSLGYFVFAHNQSGTFVNQTFTSTSGASASVSYTLRINKIKDSKICGLFWFNDSNSNINFTNQTCFTVQNSRPTLKTDLSFSNSSIGHSFNATAVFSDLDGSDDFSNYTIESSLGTCQTIGNTSSGNDMIVSYNCTGTALVSTTVRINVTDDSDYNISSSQLTNTYPNNIPSLNGIEINDTSPLENDNLNCSFTSLSDTDDDTVLVIGYDWLLNSASQGINSSWLDTGNTSASENWQCTIVANDGYENSTLYTSGSVSIGTNFKAPILNWTNSTDYITFVNSTVATPVNNNSAINLSVTFYDENPEDAWTAYFCSTNSVTASGCTSTTYCNSSVNITNTNLSCIYNISEITDTTLTYYAFVVDNTSLISSPFENVMHINHPSDVPTLIVPTGNSSLNYTFINYSSSDLDSDDINFTIYNSTDGVTYSQLYTGTNSYFNYTNVSDGTYYIKSYAFDQHNYYYSLNSSVFSFTVDSTFPSLNNVYVSSSSVYTTGSVNFYTNATDYNNLTSVSCKFTLSKSDYLGGAPFNLTSNSKSNDLISVLQTMAAYGTGTLELTKAYCTDSFGNTAENSSVGINITISTETVTPISPGGGGSTTTQTVIQKPTTNVSEIVGLCGNGICESDETPWGCFEDCGPKLFEFDQIFCLPLFACGNWETEWFNNLMILLVLVAIGWWYFKKNNPNFHLFKKKARRGY